MTGPLGVSHLLLFSRSQNGNANLRIALTPRGPTLHFRIENYSLCKDVKRAMKHPVNNDKMHRTPPLLVMNNFTSPASADGSAPAVPKHLESLTTTIFQSLFPAISPQSTPLSSIQRVMLLNRELPKQDTQDKTGAYVINVRHYAITTKKAGLSRSIRKINAAERVIKNSSKRNGVPNLNKLEDVADYILDPSAAASGFTSGSDTEAETDAEVEVLDTSARKLLSRRKLEAMNKRSEDPIAASRTEKKAVKLVELGPRMKLRMTKMEEGVCDGKVMWHEYIAKTKEEVKEQDLAWEKKRQEKEERKRIQKENVAKKMDKGKGNDAPDDLNEDAWDSEDFSEAESDDDKGEEMDIDNPIRIPIS